MGCSAARSDLGIRSQCDRAIRRWELSSKFSAPPTTLSPSSLTVLDYYTATGLLPGLYTLKVSAPSFLPHCVRRSAFAPAPASTSISPSILCLGVMQLGPVRDLPDEDDWKWTLRSVANRPILRVFDDPTLIAEKQSHDLRGTLSFLAGSTGGGYGNRFGHEYRIHPRALGSLRWTSQLSAATLDTVLALPAAVLERWLLQSSPRRFDSLSLSRCAVSPPPILISATPLCRPFRLRRKRLGARRRLELKFGSEFRPSSSSAT